MQSPATALGLAAATIFVSRLAMGDEAGKSESFENRVAIAKQAEDDKTYKSYLPTMYDAVGQELASAMQACFKEIPDGSSDPFVFITDIDRSGVAQAAEVKPATTIATCFQRRVSALKFPKPPDYPGRAGFPIVIEMSIRP